jgi:hypothetical protein
MRGNVGKRGETPLKFRHDFFDNAVGKFFHH